MSDNVFIYASLIMKDEAVNIDRCLNNISKIVDGYYISDTGSTDNSVNIAKNVLSKIGKPNMVEEHQWVDFSTNRNISLRGCDRLIKSEIKKNLNIDLSKPLLMKEIKRLEKYRFYYFVTDLDNILDYDNNTYYKSLNEIEVIPQPQFSKNVKKSLSQDAYYVKSYRVSVYNTINLIKFDPLEINTWEYTCSVHEVIVSNKPWYNPIIDHLNGYINYYFMNGVRSRDSSLSLIRDLQYLHKDYKLNPEDKRISYHLAQTYNNLGDRNKAIKFYWDVYNSDYEDIDYKYKALLCLAGFYNSNIYFTHYNARYITDECFKNEKHENKFIFYILKAYELKYNRIEALYLISEYYKYKKMHLIGWTLVKPFIDMKFNKYCKFKLQNITECKLYLSAAVNSYYAEDYKSSYKLYNRIINSKSTNPVDKHVIEIAKSEINFALNKIKK